jgi:hypothetical protein
VKRIMRKIHNRLLGIMSRIVLPIVMKNSSRTLSYSEFYKNKRRASLFEINYFPSGICLYGSVLKSKWRRTRQPDLGV